MGFIKSTLMVLRLVCLTLFFASAFADEQLNRRVEAASDGVVTIDNKAGFIKSEYRDANTPTTRNAQILAPSPYWGNEPIWDSHTNIHNPMFDEKGRLWLTARIRQANNQPAYCKAGSKHPSAMAYPKDTSTRQVEVYDPKTQKIPAIAVTASVMQQDRKLITEAGFDGYIGKPINLKEFLDTVRATLERQLK